MITQYYLIYNKGILIVIMLVIEIRQKVFSYQPLMMNYEDLYLLLIGKPEITVRDPMLNITATNRQLKCVPL